MIYEASHTDDWHSFSCHISTVVYLCALQIDRLQREEIVYRIINDVSWITSADHRQLFHSISHLISSIRYSTIYNSVFQFRHVLAPKYYVLYTFPRIKLKYNARCYYADFDIIIKCQDIYIREIIFILKYHKRILCVPHECLFLDGEDTFST